MQLRFERSQLKSFSTPPGGRVRFSLTAEAVLSDEERFVLDKYNLRRAALVLEDTLELLKKSMRTGIIVSVLLSLVIYAVLASLLPSAPFSFAPRQSNVVYYSPFNITLLVGFVLFILVTLVHYNKFRQNIYVNDLLRGRTFRCKSIVELAQKEAYLQVVCDFFRQVLQTAQHWDGKEVIDIQPMNPEDAKAAIVRGL